MIVDLQVNQGAAPWPVLRDVALAAEDAGFGTLWSLDHFSGGMFGSDSMPECFSVLSAWAAVTSRIGVGTLVANVMNRHPGLLANAASTVQEVSGGRFILGLGAGAAPGSAWAREHEVLGFELLPTMAQRHHRLVETVGFLRDVWAPDRNEKYAGFPLPRPVPPMVLGVNSEGLGRVAGEMFDGVNVRADHPQRAAVLRAALEARDGREGFDVSVWTWLEPDAPFDFSAFAAEGATRVVLVQRGAPDVSAISGMAKYLS